MATQNSTNFFICVIYILGKDFVYTNYIKTWYSKIFGI